MTIQTGRKEPERQTQEDDQRVEGAEDCTSLGVGHRAGFDNAAPTAPSPGCPSTITFAEEPWCVEIPTPCFDRDRSSCLLLFNGNSMATMQQQQRHAIGSKDVRIQLLALANSSWSTHSLELKDDHDWLRSFISNISSSAYAVAATSSSDARSTAALPATALASRVKK